MKKLFLFAISFSVLSLSVKAQNAIVVKSKLVSAPAAIKSDFEAQFIGSQNQKWSKSTLGNYVVNFERQTGVREIVEYSVKGDIISARSFYSAAVIPEVINNAIGKKFATAEWKDVVRVEVPGVAAYYKAKLKDVKGNREHELFISETGNISL